MNDFERRVVQEYVNHHAVPLMQETTELADLMKDVADPKEFQEQQMSLASMYRFVYLALREYHAALSQNLAERGISLPDLDTLVSSSAPHD